MLKKGFCERAYQTEREWHGKPIYEAVIDGVKVNFFTDKGILAYSGKEVEYEETKKGDYLNGALPKDGSKSADSRYRGKSPEEILMHNKSMVLSYAKDIVVALIAEGHIVSAESAMADWQKLFSVIVGNVVGGKSEPF